MRKRFWIYPTKRWNPETEKFDQESVDVQVINDEDDVQNLIRSATVGIMAVALTPDERIFTRDEIKDIILDARNQSKQDRYTWTLGKFLDELFGVPEYKSKSEMRRIEHMKSAKDAENK